MAKLSARGRTVLASEKCGKYLLKLCLQETAKTMQYQVLGRHSELSSTYDVKWEGQIFPKANKDVWNTLCKDVATSFFGVLCERYGKL